ncbi:MAG: hypothetical protein AB7V27_02235 [Candidatus Binatia bacterium]
MQRTTTTLLKWLRASRSLAGAAAVAALVSGSGCGSGDPPPGFFFFTLEEGTPVDIEITAITADPGTTAALKLHDVVLDEPSESIQIGQAVEGLHVHPEWLATAPGGPFVAYTFSISFRLTTESATYEDSDEYTALLQLTSEPPSPDQHESEIFIGSTRQGGGQLAAQYDFDEPILLFFDQCLIGGEQPCTGGIALYSNTDPGFAPHE